MDIPILTPPTGVLTLVFLGRTGNGKSATGNSIIGRKAFKSRAGTSGVTRTCEMQQTVLPDGEKLNVIDTPGLFDIAVEPDFLEKEISSCITLAKDGIHAFILVLSVRTRFSAEEEAAIQSLRILFGNKVVNYMIVLFTGGDELEENDETLEDYLGSNHPQPLKEVLSLCDHRVVLFDNKTKDEKKKAEQVKRLLSLVGIMVDRNDGKPYTNELFAEVKLHEQKKAARSSKGYTKEDIEQMQKSNEELHKRIVDMLEAKLRDTTAILEQRLADEKAARAKAENLSHAERTKSDAEIRRLREDLERAKGENDVLRNKKTGGGGKTSGGGGGRGGGICRLQ